MPNPDLREKVVEVIYQYTDYRVDRAKLTDRILALFPEGDWHEYYKNIIEQIHHDHQSVVAEKDKRIKEKE